MTATFKATRAAAYSDPQTQASLRSYRRKAILWLVITFVVPPLLTVPVAALFGEDAAVGVTALWMIGGPIVWIVCIIVVVRARRMRRVLEGSRWVKRTGKWLHQSNMRALVLDPVDGQSEHTVFSSNDPPFRSTNTPDASDLLVATGDGKLSVVTAPDRRKLIWVRRPSRESFTANVIKSVTATPLSTPTLRTIRREYGQCSRCDAVLTLTVAFVLIPRGNVVAMLVLFALALVPMALFKRRWERMANEDRATRRSSISDAQRRA